MDIYTVPQGPLLEGEEGVSEVPDIPLQFHPVRVQRRTASVCLVDRWEVLVVTATKPPINMTYKITKKTGKLRRTDSTCLSPT